VAAQSVETLVDALPPFPADPKQIFFVGLYLDIGKKGRSVEKEAGKVRDMSSSRRVGAGGEGAGGGGGGGKGGGGTGGAGGAGAGGAGGAGGGTKFVASNVYWLTRGSLLVQVSFASIVGLFCSYGRSLLPL